MKTVSILEIVAPIKQTIILAGALRLHELLIRPLIPRWFVIFVFWAS